MKRSVRETATGQFKQICDRRRSNSNCQTDLSHESASKPREGWPRPWPHPQVGLGSRTASIAAVAVSLTGERDYGIESIGVI